MSAPFDTIRTFAEIPAAIGRMQVAGAGHRVLLLQAVYRGRIAHLEVQRDTSSSLFKRWVAASRLPGLLLIGDDDYARPDGPDSWPIAPRAMRWCRALIVHGGRGEAAHYEMAVTLTETIGRVAMIECSSTNVAAWHLVASKWARVPCLTLAPESGRVHPNDTRETMQ